MKGKHLGVVLLVVTVGLIVYLAFIMDPRDGPMPYDEFSVIFDSAGGWVALRVPDSKYEPGAIIHLSPERGLRYISHLRECGYPADVLAPVVGALPVVSTDRALGFDAEMLARLPGARVGPEGQRVYRVGLDIDSMTAEALDGIRVQQWRTYNDTAVSDVCRSQLQAENTFIVGEAARVHRAAYSFYDSASARVAVDQARLDDIVELGANAGARVDSEGRVVIPTTVTVAIRRAVQGPTGLEVLSPGGPTTTPGDSLLAAIVRAGGGEGMRP